MKEIKYNLRLLYNKKEVYYFILGVLFVNAVHVFFVINQYVPDAILKTAEYQFILYNNEVTVTTLLILAFPVLAALAFGDTSWNEKTNKSYVCLFPRLDAHKNIWLRLLLTILITFIVCFLGFMLNYIALYFIMGSGNNITHSMEWPFYLWVFPDFFLDTVRNFNPVLFTVLTSLHVSFMYALLSGLSYTLSFFTKQKLVIYFQVLLVMIILEVGFSFIGLGDFSIVKQLQPFSKFSIYQSCIVYILLFLITTVPLVILNKKKDML